MFISKRNSKLTQHRYPTFIKIVFGSLMVTALSACNVNVTKTTGGSVKSQDGNINCGDTCTAAYDKANVAVKLTATPMSGYVFTGFDGACLNKPAPNDNTCDLMVGGLSGHKKIHAKFAVSNEAPSLTVIANRTVNEGQTIQIALAASDPAGKPLTFTPTNLPSFATLNNLQNGKASITASPDYDDAGTYAISVNVSNGASSASGTFTLTVADTPRAAVSAGGYHSCKINNTQVTCWGSNNDDEGKVVNQTLVPSLNKPNSVQAGGYHSCAIDSVGVKCWGGNPMIGQSNVPAGLKNPRALTTGYEHSCVIDDGGVACWGSDFDYSGNYTGQSTIPGTVKSATAVAAGGSHTCAITNGTVVCWGRNTDGESTAPKTLKNPKAIATGSQHSCAIDDNGVTCWGSNTDFRGNVTGQLTVPAGLTKPTAIAAGGSHNCVIDNNRVVCWGGNSDKQSKVPTGIMNPVSITAGYLHSCVQHDGGTTCWGNNSAGQSTAQ